MKRHLLLYSGIGAGVLVFAVALFAATRTRGRDEARGTEGTPALDVSLATAAVSSLAQPFEIGGDVRARQTATITSRIVAQIEAVKVLPGDRVRAGQPLVVLDARDLTAARTRSQAAVTAAEQAAQLAGAERQAADAALTLATITYKRIADLRARNSATPAELDDARASLDAAQARVKSAEAQVAQAAAGIEVAHAAAEGAVVGQSWATLRAPFDGVVTQKLVDAGNMAAPGVPLLTVEDTSGFRLEVRVDESRASLVALGQAVDVALDGAGRGTVAGRVAEMARMLDPSAHAFLAKIDLPAVPGVRAGMFGRARFAGPAATALAVPEASIVRRGQLTSVFVVDRSNTARLRLVTVGEPLNGQVEVRAGLDTGETFVVAPPATLVDGARVRARSTAGAGAQAALSGEVRQ